MRYGNVEIKKQTQISDDIKQFSYEICQKHKVIIRYMETDKDHIWKKYPDYLRKHFWKEHTFWTDRYFACSVGNVSEEMLKRYIENQG